jgi:membrane-bound serine protease (ClpP class)
VELSDPTLVFLLVTLGLVGIGVEVLTPGGFLPAIVGIVALVLGVVGFVEIDAPGGGIGLLLVSIAFFIAAAALRRYTTLSIAGTVFLILSGIFMFDRDTDPTSIPVVTIAGLVLGGFMMFVIERAGKARSRPVMTGWEELLGMTGEVRSGLNPTGQIFVDGALWRAELSPEAAAAGPVPVGESVRVESVRGLTLVVVRAMPGDPPVQESDTEGVTQ